jgi:hypothetical protein
MRALRLLDLRNGSMDVGKDEELRQLAENNRGGAFKDNMAAYIVPAVGDCYYLEDIKNAFYFMYGYEYGDRLLANMKMADKLWDELMVAVDKYREAEVASN